jgi:hypothetical protein
MHHPRSISSIARFRFAALLLFGNCLLAPVTAVLLTHSMIHDNRRLAAIGAGLVILSLALIVAQWLAASRAGCPLCGTPVLAPKACMKHRRARRFFGSHRLRVALQILFRNRFRCPYCNESTGMEVRETLRRPPSRRSMLD